MTLLKAALEHSWLLGPWTRLAQTSGLQIAGWIERSRLMAPCRVLLASPKDSNKQFQRFGATVRWMLTLGVLGLFVLLSFSSTGIIGGLTGLLFGIVLAAALLLRPAILSRLTIIDVLVGLFLGSAIISTAFSSFLPTSVIGLAKMLTFIAGYIVFRVVSESGSSTITAALGLLALIGLGESLIGFYQYANHIQPLATWSDQSINPELQMSRIFGTLQPSNPNLLAGFLIPGFAAACSLGLMFARPKTWLLSAIGLAASAAILIALVLTGSRGGFLAIGTMFICLFAFLGHLIWYNPSLRNFKWMKPAWLIILVVSLLTVGGGVMRSEKIRTRVLSMFAMREDSSISYRLNVYNSARQMVRDNPIVGIGPGNGTFKLVYGLYMVPGYNALGAYSVPLEIAVEQGVIGLVIFLSLLLVLMLRAFLALDAPHLTLQQKILIGGLLTGILGSFMYGIFDTIWYRPSVNLLFWFMVAALATLTEPRPAASLSAKEPSRHAA
ncbi:O-antigen ligase family protein [Vampirovibrio sp.]|uniref:O-antigen ligase family protein n=1 Tax=Vampirovibrio sp. TaxID=2717857 RepID=UPI0035933865